jgi:hypothetical protein
MSNEVICSICRRPESVKCALRVEMSRVDAVWLCPLCLDAVFKAVEREDYLAELRRGSGIRRIK